MMTAGAHDADAGPEEVERLLYHITHDLRACFRAVRVIPDWIREDLASGSDIAELEAHLDMLQTQAARGDRILLDLREFSRVGRMVGAATRSDVRDLAAQVWAGLDPPDGMTLDLDAAEGTVWGPPEDMERLFAALLGNVVKHHDLPVGRVRIVSGPEGHRTAIRIQDDGPGIPARFRPRVFELLTTLKPRDMCEGSGVGLAMSRKIVGLSGGSIALGDAAGERGLAVLFDLPQGPEDHAYAMAATGAPGVATERVPAHVMMGSDGAHAGQAGETVRPVIDFDAEDDGLEEAGIGSREGRRLN